MSVNTTTIATTTTTTTTTTNNNNNNDNNSNNMRNVKCTAGRPFLPVLRFHLPEVMSAADSKPQQTP